MPKTQQNRLSAPKKASWYRDHFGDHAMRRVPRGDLSTYLPAEISSYKGSPVLLVSVNNANRVPRALGINVQFMFEGWEPNVNKFCLVGEDGVVHYVQPSY